MSEAGCIPKLHTTWRFSMLLKYLDCTWGKGGKITNFIYAWKCWPGYTSIHSCSHHCAESTDLGDVIPLLRACPFFAFCYSEKMPNRNRIYAQAWQLLIFMCFYTEVLVFVVFSWLPLLLLRSTLIYKFHKMKYIKLNPLSYKKHIGILSAIKGEHLSLNRKFLTYSSTLLHYFSQC